MNDAIAPGSGATSMRQRLEVEAYFVALDEERLIRGLFTDPDQCRDRARLMGFQVNVLRVSASGSPSEYFGMPFGDALRLAAEGCPND